MATAAILDFWNREILLPIRVAGLRRFSMPNFVKIGQSVAKILRFFDFSRWRPPPSWIFEFVNFYLLTVYRGPRRITVSNFIKISRSFAEILRFFEFLRWPPPLSWIFDITKFYWLLGSRGSRCIGVPNFWKIGQSVAKILRFFSIFKMAAVRHLGFVWGIFGPLTVSIWGLYQSAKFGDDRCSSFYNMNISIFGPFGWKMPIHAPKIVFFGQFDPLNGLQYQPKPKRYILAWVCVIWAIKRVYLASGLTCRCVS